MLYDPDFYEHQALLHAAELLQAPVETNVLLSRQVSGRSWRSGEVDGVARCKGAIGIEVKSFPLDEDQYRRIVEKYRLWPLTQVVVIAPGKTGNYSTSARAPLEVFLPETDQLNELQAAAIRSTDYPESIAREIASGRHHFRYRAAVRTKGTALRAFVNQVSKVLSSPESIARDILRLSVPVQRVYWSKSRLLSPKDLFYRERRAYIMGGFRVLDVDGDLIHRPFHPCRLERGSTTCSACRCFSRATAQRLISLLEEADSSPTVIDSGKKGYHLYVWNDMDASSLLRRLSLEKIKIDRAVLTDVQGVVGFPGSVYGDTGRRVLPCTLSA